MRLIFNTKIKFIFWIILTIIIGIFFAYFLLKNTDYDKIIGPQKNTAIALDSLTTKETAEYSYFIKTSKKPLSISAKAYLVGDLDTGEIILQKNEDKQFPIASVSKLITAFIAKESTDQDDTTKVSKNALATYGENGNFKLGEKIKISDLLYPLLLESSNDAAEIIAEYFTREKFVKKMNQIVEKLELSKTSFEDPSGLSPNNKSTVYDMFKLIGYINQKEPELFQITTKRNYSNEKHNWFSNNQFLFKKEYTGGKSGYTDEALQTVVSTFLIPLSETSNRHIAIALLQSKDRFKDVENILKFLNKNVYYGGKSDNIAWIKEKENVSEIYDQDYVNLIFGGDIMLDRGVESSVNKNFAGNFSALFEKLEILEKADIAFANLEGPASDIGKDLGNLYSFRMNPSVIPALKGSGIDIVSVANNHAGDWGRNAYANTLSRLKENEISYIGGEISESKAEIPVIIEKYGMKIGYLGFSDVGPEWMKAGEQQAGILLANNPRFDEIIQNASKQVDYLIVSFHFGEEYKTEHNVKQAYLSHRAIDNGAKIVIGTHPHVAQDTEVYKNGFIAYSLGNFIFDQGFSTNTMQGMLLEIKLNRDGSMSIKKNTVKLNKLFQPDKIIIGKEEKIKSR